MSKRAKRCGSLFGCWAHLERRYKCKSMQSGEDSTLCLEKDRGATMLKATDAGALRQRLQKRHGVEGRPERVAMKFLKHQLPSRTE
eukprot:5975476-Pleurochrysis_carterae.AAC.1